MKKIIIYSIIIIGLLSPIFIYIYNHSVKMTKINIIQVQNKVIYAPEYIALTKNYFKHQNLTVKIITVPNYSMFNNKILTNKYIGLCDVEKVSDMQDNNENNYLINFGKITTKDINFIVSKNKEDINNMDNKDIIVNDLDNIYFNNISNIKLIKYMTDNSVKRAFIESSNNSLAILNENDALDIERKELGYIIRPLSYFEKDMLYLVYGYPKNYIHKDIDDSFNEAINKALAYIYSNNSKKIAKTIYEYFPDLSVNELTEMINLYKNNNIWATKSYFTDNDFKYIKQIIDN